MTPPRKDAEIIDGYTIKYHSNGKTRWSKGKVVNGQPEGYWEWYRIDGTIKRSGHFSAGETVGEWITFDKTGEPHKTTNYDRTANN
jgi:antitoxin component YwqK of YwqJK toxin-antitoxin module